MPVRRSPHEDRKRVLPRALAETDLRAVAAGYALGTLGAALVIAQIAREAIF